MKVKWLWQINGELVRNNDRLLRKSLNLNVARARVCQLFQMLRLVHAGHLGLPHDALEGGQSGNYYSLCPKYGNHWHVWAISTATMQQ
jgi:hypothetical protein